MENKVVLVVGCGRDNIGLAVARKFAGEGYAVIGIDTNCDLNRESQDFKNVFREFFMVDITSEEQVEDLFARIEGSFGRLDAVVNSAGINILGPIDAYDATKLRTVLDVNLVAQFILLNAYVKHFDNDGNKKNYLAVTSDTGSFLAKTSTFAYGASKAGANGLLQCVARELNKYHDDNWTIIPFAAGCVDGTPMDLRTVNDVSEQRGISKDEARKMLTANIPKHRGFSMPEIAEWIYFLMTKGEYASGNVLRVDNNQQQG